MVMTFSFRRTGVCNGRLGEHCRWLLWNDARAHTVTTKQCPIRVCVQCEYMYVLYASVFVLLLYACYCRFAVLCYMHYQGAVVFSVDLSILNERKL